MNDNDKKVLKLILNDIDEGDVDEDVGYEASNAAEALEQVRRTFYGTPFEQTLTNALIICDALANRCKELS